MKNFSKFFLLQFVQYLLVTANYRAISQGLLVWTCLTDAAIVGLGAVLTIQVVENRTKSGRVGLICGGACGSVAGIILTRVVYGQ